MIKNIRKINVLVCGILLFSFVVSCSKVEINTPCMLADCYLNEIFSENDIKNIAMLRVGYVAVVDSREQDAEDYRRENFEETTFKPLTEKQKNDIENSYIRLNGKITKFEITGYYGNYNGRYVVEVDVRTEGEEVVTSVEKIIVANIFLGFIGASHEIYVCELDA